jgi:hypothetical protein
MSLVRAQIAEALILANEFKVQENIENFSEFSFVSSGMSVMCKELQAMEDEEIASYSSAFDVLIPKMRAILEDGDYDEIYSLKSDIADILELFL